MASSQNAKARLFACATRKGCFFISKSSGNTWKIYWKFVSKAWACTNTSVFKRPKTPAKLFFFLCAEEEFHLIIMLFGRKTVRQETEKGEKTENPSKASGLKRCPNWTLRGLCFPLGWRQLRSPEFVAPPRDSEQLRPGLLWIVSSTRGKVYKQQIAVVFVTPGESDLPANRPPEPPSRTPETRPPTSTSPCVVGLGWMMMMMMTRLALFA